MNFCPQVKESLLILTQHNMTRVEMPTERELRRARAASSGAANIRLHYSVSDDKTLEIFPGLSLLKY